MSSTADTPDTAPEGRVTIELVRQTLGDTDPWSINASALRNRLETPRGSNTTWQRHLDTIRQERRAATVLDASGGEVPPAPREAVDAIWRAAWSSAQTALLQRLERVTVERDTAVQRLEVRSQEAATMADEMAELEAANEAAKAAQQQAEAARDALKSERDKLAQDLEAARQEGKTVLHDAEQQAGIAARDAALKTQVLQDALDRAGQREGELRAQLSEAQRRIDDLLTRIAPQSQKGGAQ